MDSNAYCTVQQRERENNNWGESTLQYLRVYREMSRANANQEVFAKSLTPPSEIDPKDSILFPTEMHDHDR